MKHPLITSLTALSLIATSCTVSQEEPDFVKVDYNDFDSKKISMVVDFYESVSGTSSRSLERKLIVDDIKSDYYRAELENIPKKMVIIETRAEEDSMVFDISTVVFHIGESKGFALLSTHKKINRIFFFTQNGELGDTTNNIILRDILLDAPFAGTSMLSDGISDDEEDQEEDPENPNGGTPSGIGGGSDYLYNDTLKTKWGQGIPYNRYVKYCDCEKCSHIGRGYHMPVGCVAIATAQFIAKFGNFNGTFYANRNIQFDLFNNKTRPTTAGEEETIAFFVREVALGCQIKFGCSGSSSHTKSAYQYLKDIGYDVSYHEDHMDQNTAKKCLSQGWPMIMGGNEGLTGDGHAWILDGMRHSKGKTEYHCNWGWYGDSDGWLDSYYVARPLNPDGTRDECHFWYTKNRFI